MPKTLYLHIGMHKTGTTAIQIGLRENEPKLAELGYALPRAGVSGTTHNNLAFELRSLSRFDPEKGTVDDLADEISDSHLDRHIVSAEALDYLSADEVAVLRQKLSRFEVRIIVYLRRQVEWLQSEWSEIVKLRFYQNDFKTLAAQRTADDRRLRYFEFLEAWSNEFGKDNLRVRVFERDRFLNGDIFLDFLATCDVEGEHEWQRAPLANVSPGIKTLEVIRRYVHHFMDVVPSNRLLGRCKRIVEYSNQEGWNNEPLNLIDRDLFESVQGAFRSDNNEVAKAYLGCDRLFNEAFEERPITHYNVDGMSADEVFRLTRYLQEKP